MPTALVTDSTATLSADVVEDLGVTVVPLQVVIGAKSYSEGIDEEATPSFVAAALKEWAPVSTSRPSPEAMLRVYRDAAESGATDILSVHLSGEVSGTVESALLAAERAPIPVTVVDSRQVGFGTGFALLAAARALAEGAGVEEAAARARRTGEQTSSLFYVDTMEYLRRGGRVGAAAALLGSALAVKPILRLTDGKVGPYERVRTASKALARLEELIVVAAEGDGPLDIAVGHLANADRADALAMRLSGRLADRLDGVPVRVAEIGAVLGAHVGPGMVAAAVSVR